MPKSADAIRQPNEVSPYSHSPTAISSLPTGGWTTYSPQRGAGAAEVEVVCPATICAFAFGNWVQVHSTPCCRMVQASFT